MDLGRLLFWGRKEKHSSLLENEYLFSRFDQTGPIDKYVFTVFDTELTGLDPKHDQIVSIGAVRIRDLKIVTDENFFSYVKPTRDLPKVSTLIHGITPQRLADAPSLDEVLPDFVKWCGRSLLVGHYVSLDMAFVNRAARRIMGGSLQNPCVDTVKLVQILQEHEIRSRFGASDPDPSYNLGRLARQYKLPLFAQHDALEDAFQTAYLFVFAVRSLLREGFTTLRDFYMAGKQKSR
jgi:DNA polymerase-3 subunit epsilon